MDSALIDTLSKWKRRLAVELAEKDHKVKHEQISILFNSVIFVRAIEDYSRHQQPTATRALLAWWLSAESPKDVEQCVKSCFEALHNTGESPPPWLKMEELAIFNHLDSGTVTQLFNDFYSVTGVPYDYDFSLMSKHALSRIYERYVSLLREPMSPSAGTSRPAQGMLFSIPDTPEEVNERAYGGIYTPQYIAKFFARFLKESLAPSKFRLLKACDPS